MSDYLSQNGYQYSKSEIELEAKTAGIEFDQFVKSNNLKFIGEPEQSDTVNWFDQTWLGRGIAAASTTGEATDLLLEGSNVDIATVRDFIAAKEQEAKDYIPSERMQKFQEQYKKDGSSWSAFFKGVARDPALMAELFVQSLGTQIGTAIDAPESLAALGVGAAGGALAGPAGAVVGAMGGLATSMEAALTFGELIEKELEADGKEFTDENIKALLEGPKGNSIRNKAVGRGLAIGSIEALSGGLAVKATAGAAKAVAGAAKAGRRAKLSGVGAGVATEAAGGATGEIAGRAVAGQEMDPAEIGFEAITGTVTAPITVAYGLNSYKKPKYVLNKEEVTYNQMKQFVDTADDIDVAKANIKIENDFTGVGEKATKKQEAAIAAIRATGDEEVIADVEKTVRENRISDTIAFAQSQGKKIGKDVLIVENDTEAQAAYDKIAEESKLKAENVKGADGFIIGDSIIINKDIAGRKGQINVGAHEILHGILAKHLKSLNVEQRQKLISDFTSTISIKSKNYIQNILEERNKDTVDEKTGETIKGENLDLKTTDEWFSVYSDGITKKQITFNESIATKIRNFLQNIFRKFGYNKEFSSGLDTYNFMRDYQKSIKEGALSQRALDVAGGGAAVADVTFSKDIAKKTLDDIGKPENFDSSNQEITNQLPGMVKAQVDNYFNNRPSLKADENVRQEVQAEILLRLINPSKTGKTDVNSFNPKINDSLYGYLNKRINYRMLDTFKENPTIVPDFTKADFDEATKFLTTEDVVTTKKTEGVKTKLVQTKARQLTSLADLDIEGSRLIKETTRIQLTKLIESNPKNLVQEIQNVLISDIAEIQRKEMGVIGEKKGELFIPDSYKAYLANTYEQTISSMEILKIRTNYKNLFKREKMGFADYKTKKSDKPSLKKDSNYRKEIFRNITTKAEFTKYHTEGKKNKLIANQRNLALMRAEAEVAQAVDNYLMDNAVNENEKFGASLRSFVDTKTIDKQKLEDKSFDSVQYSRTTINDAFYLRDQVLQGKNVFDDSGNLLAPYNAISKDKKELQKVGDFIFENMHLLVPENDISFLKKTYNKLIKEGKRGTAFEQNLIDVAIQAEKTFGKGNVEVIIREPQETDALPDVILRVAGVDLNIEAKMTNAQYGSVTFSVNGITFNINKDYSFKDVLLKQLGDKVQLSIKESQKFLRKKYDYEWNNIKIIPTEYHNALKNNINPKTGNTYYADMSATIPFDLDNISEIYNKKKHPVYLIQLMGRGLFSMGGDIFGLDIPQFIGKGFIKLRRVPNSQYETVTIQGGKTMKIKTGNTTYNWRAIPGVTNETLNSLQSNETIGNVAGLKKLLNKPGLIENLKVKKRAIDSGTFQKAISRSRTPKESKGITVLDFDDTLATTKSLVRYTSPTGKTGTLNAEQYALQYQSLQAQGYTFDFSEFNKVVKGKIAPLFQKALKLQGKFGSKNMFVLTARPPQSAQAIFDFLKANGLNIPIENITGLGNSTAEAKALWIADKVGEGFNDFYFADDALQNVQAVDNMLEQFDVKRKVQQAKVKFSKTRNETFNDILQEITGIESKKRFARTKARKRGADKGKFRFFIPPSHEDFVGLLYNFLGKGKRGDAHRNFFEKALVRPLNRANRELDAARQAIANDYKALNKQFPEIKKMLTKKTPDGDFTYQDAIRIYLWDKHGYTIPGLSPVDQKNLVNLIKASPALQSYAEAINTISKQETYVNPTEGWESGDLRMDLDDATGRVGREQFFAEFNEAADEIFSEENLNKIEAGYGNGVREALEDILYRIKTGRNRAAGTNRLVNNFMNFINGAVGGVMFFNIRSATLQQMSLVNYINFADNNIFAAAKAFANQKQYWADFAFIFNSDMLKQRRGGIQTDVNGAELAETISKSKYPIRTLIRKLLQLGFLPTQIGDNIAISTGGATYYRNRINKYLREGLSQKEAENKAFDDFQEITQKTQQSARPDMLSQQQVSPLGRPILAFQNVTSQFNRLGKKAAQDMYNRRITPPNTTLLQSDISNASRILYYFAVQNLVFYSLQTALFAAMFSDDEEDTEFFTKKRDRLINGSIDSVLRGSGIHGAIFSTLKNMAIKFAEQRGKTYNPDESAVMMEMFNLSPPLGIKARRIANAEKTLFYNKKVIDEMSFFDIDNPQWSAYTNYVQGVTNLPVNRLYNKVQNLRQALNSENQAYQRLLMFLGWSQYNLGIENKKIESIKKSKKKQKFSTKPTAVFK